MTLILLDDGLLGVTGYWMNKFIGRVSNGSAFFNLEIINSKPATSAIKVQISAV
jgi:hypothetical protein